MAAEKVVEDDIGEKDGASRGLSKMIDLKDYKLFLLVLGHMAC